MTQIKSADELDLRLFPSRAKLSKLFEVFDQLVIGEKVVLISDTNPRPLLYQFVLERNNQSIWSPLEEGPRLWRIEVAKRDPKYPRRIQNVLGEDHIRLDSIFFHFEKVVRAGHWLEAMKYFGEFRTGLERHIRMEEEILFPELEERRAVGENLSLILWEEHKTIKAILSDLGILLSEVSGKSGETIGSAEKIEKTMANLFGQLQHHNAREELLLYKLCDNLLSDVEKADILQRMELI